MAKRAIFQFNFDTKLLLQPFCYTGGLHPRKSILKSTDNYRSRHSGSFQTRFTMPDHDLLSFSGALAAFYFVLAFAAAFLLFQTSRILMLSAFFWAAVIDLIFAPAAGFDAGADFAFRVLLFAQYSRILCAWAFLSAAVRFRPLRLPAGVDSV
jgi:hypothetical protein